MLFVQYPQAERQFEDIGDTFSIVDQKKVGNQ
jgi:hypothetical protein